MAEDTEQRKLEDDLMTLTIPTWRVFRQQVEALGATVRVTVTVDVDDGIPVQARVAKTPPMNGKDILIFNTLEAADKIKEISDRAEEHYQMYGDGSSESALIDAIRHIDGVVRLLKQDFERLKNGALDQVDGKTTFRT